MSRLHLIVEGQTEQAFAAKLLVPHLADKGVYLFPPQLAAHARKRGVPHRGGVISYQPFRNDVVRRLKEDQSNDVFFSTMIDLYRLPNDFPGTAAAQSQLDPYRRVESLEKSLGEDIADSRFLPYIQLHEFEAILLAKPQVFDIYYDNFVREIEQLIKLAATVDSPERINDGETTAPSKRIAALIPDYSRAKPTAGPIIAAKIGLRAIREKCPHFDAWLRRLEILGENQ
jgi:hypothetical protein